MTSSSFLKTAKPASGSILCLCALMFAICTAATAQTPATLDEETQRLVQLARTAEQEGRHEDALRALQTIATNPSVSPQTAALTLISIGHVYLSLRKYDEALSAFQRSITLDGTSADAYNDLGGALGYLKRYAEAIEAFQQAVARNPDLLIARHNMGVAYSLMGQLKYAEFVYKNLVRDHPDYALGQDGMAATLAKSGRASEAIPFHEKAISLSPENPTFYYNLGITYLILHNREKAQEQQQKLRDLDPKMADRLANLIATQTK